MSSFAPLRIPRALAATGAVTLLVAMLLPACGSDAAVSEGSSSGTPIFDGSFDTCGTPQDGCPCTEPGKEVACGSVHSTVGDQVICSMGTRTCGEGTWGGCVGSDTVVMSTSTRNVGLHTLAVTSTACGALNPCDPYCNVFDDNPATITLPPGVMVGPGGITVTGAGAAVACKVPVDWTSVYNLLPTTQRSNGAAPTACSTATNNCSFDLKCSAGTCVSRAVGEGGSCTGVDFTLGTPCWDGAYSNIQICNRGTVAATTGILPIAHYTGVMSPAASTCTAPTSGQAGDCSIDLSVKSLDPGECTSFIPAIDCPLSVANDSGDQFFIVNRSNTGMPVIGGECNTCNNFTASKDTARSPSVAGAACNAVSCGGAGTPTATQPATYSNVAGLNTCSGSQDLISNPCNADPYRICQQDFHCDTATNSCVWNEAGAYQDPACTTNNGVDLTIGAGCDLPGNLYRVPVCNRGTKSLATGAVIKIAQTNTGGFNGWNASCNTQTLATACSHTLTAPLGPGQCVNITSCPGGGGQRYEVVNSDRSITECGGAAAGCKNNAAQVKDNGAGCAACACNSGTAELTGKILDPAKLRPVYGATVYVPSTAVGAFAGPNVQCDTCGAAFKGLPARASATTDIDGTFRLQGVPGGASFPLVIQLGRFRRQVTVAAIPACGTAALPAAQAHLPGTKTKTGDTAADTANPDLPLIALVTGHGDSLECLLAKMGIATSEFTSPAGGGAIHMYTYKKDAYLTGSVDPTPPGIGTTLGGNLANMGAADALLTTAATLNQYNSLILPCADVNTAPTAGQQTNVRSWMDLGGRLFASHHQVEDFIQNPQVAATNPNYNVANWTSADWSVGTSADQKDRASGSVSLTDTINQTFPAGIALAKWLPGAWPAPGGPGTALPAVGTLPLPNYRHDVTSVKPGATSWFDGTSNYSPTFGAQSNMMSFDTPFTLPPASQCGRAVLPFMHVSPSITGSFPTACGAVPAALSGQELAFEFMMWQSFTCLAPSSSAPVSPQPAPIPPAPPLTTTTFSTDYTATCPTGTQLKWGYFQWRSVTPGTTSISFRAATAATAAGLPASSTATGTVPTGTASGAAIVAPAWGRDAQTVNWHLQNDPPDPPQSSSAVLRVFFTMNPVGLAAPILSDWQQLYQCIPAE